MFFSAKDNVSLQLQGSTIALARAIVICCGLTIAAGCGSNESTANAEADAAHITPLTQLYAAYMNSHGGTPPASEAEFKRYIAENDRVLNAAGVSTVDELFVSPRDNEPYVILYGREAAKLISRGVVAHERKGKDGRRLVGHRMGFVNEVDEAEFRKLVPAA